MRLGRAVVWAYKYRAELRPDPAPLISLSVTRLEATETGNANSQVALITNIGSRSHDSVPGIAQPF